LVVCGDHISRCLKNGNRSTEILFSDGAGSVILTNQEPADGYKVSKISRLSLPGDSYCMTLRNNRAYPDSKFEMNGDSILEFTVKNAFPRIVTLLGLDKLARDFYVTPHQASSKVTNWISNIFNIPKENVYREDIGEIGNLAGASFMFALYNALQKSLIRPDQIVVPLAYGADLNIGGAILEPIGEPRRIVNRGRQ
jgi:3-oxoacyl-[acyl-carrier-protein] synthase III